MQERSVRLLLSCLRNLQYSVYLADILEENPNAEKHRSLPNFKYVQLDAKDEDAISSFIQSHKIEAIISSLPFYAMLPLLKWQQKITYIISI